MERWKIETPIEENENLLTASALPTATPNKAYIAYTMFNWNSRNLNGFGFRRSENNITVLPSFASTALNIGHQQNKVVGSNFEPVDDEVLVKSKSVVWKKLMEKNDKDIKDIQAVSIEGDFLREEATFEWDGADYAYPEAKELGLVDAIEFFGGDGFKDEKQVTMWIETREFIGLALVLTIPAFEEAQIETLAAEKVGGENMEKIIEQLKASVVGENEYSRILSQTLQKSDAIYKALGRVNEEYSWHYMADYTADKVIVYFDRSYYMMDYMLGEADIELSNPVEVVASWTPKTEVIPQKEGETLMADFEFTKEEYAVEVAKVTAEAIESYEKDTLPAKIDEAVASAITAYQDKEKAYASAIKELEAIKPIAADEKEMLEAEVREEDFDIEKAKLTRKIALLEAQIAEKKGTDTATATVIDGVPAIDTNVSEDNSPF